MADIKTKYAASAAVNITLASLKSTSARASSAISNAVPLFLDAFIQLKLTSTVTGVSASGTVNVYAYGSIDGGLTYSDNAKGINTAHSFSTDPPNVRLIGIMNVNKNNSVFQGPPMSVAAAFGGILPDKWGIIVHNRTGVSIRNSASQTQASYKGVWTQSV